MSVRFTTLSNGLRVVSHTVNEVETASIGVWVDAGARAEAAEVNGIAHMLEHMAFKGTARRSARDIAEEIESVGGYLNAHTSREHTAFYAKVLKEDVDLALDLLADILQNSSFDADELARERDVVIQEIGQVHDTPDDLVFDRFQEAAFPDQALGRPILGTSGVVGAFRREDLLAYMTEQYRAPRLVVSAAGRVDHAHLVARVEALFRPEPRDAARALDPARYLGGEAREERDLEQVHLVIGFPALSYHDADVDVQNVLSMILGGGMSSRLFQEVREKRGLAYSVFSFVSPYADGGLFGVYLGTSAQRCDEAVPVLCDEILKLGTALDAAELGRARAQIKAGYLMALESTSARCEQLARQVLIYGRPLDIAEMVARVEAVDGAAVQRVLGRIVQGGTPTVAAIGPVGQVPGHEAICAHFA